MAQHLVVSIDIIDTLDTTDSATMKLTMKFTNTDAATVPSVTGAVLNTTCSPRANGHMGGGRTHRSQRAGLSRSSQGQANRSTEPPSQSTKATDETELREDGPAESATAQSVTAESVTAESTAAGLAAAESATVESTGGGTAQHTLRHRASATRLDRSEPVTILLTKGAASTLLGVRLRACAEGLS